MKQYEVGLKINPASSNILTDKATIYLTRYQSSNKQEDLQKALELFEQSYSVDPENQNTLFKVSVAYFLNNDCNKAWKFHNAYKELGGNPMSKEYTAALTKNCK